MFEVDRRLLSVLRDHPIGVLDRLSRFTYRLNESGTAILIGIAAVVLLVALRRSWRALIEVAVAFALADGLASVAKGVLEVRRPPRSLSLVYTAGWAMPSSHAAFTAAAATTLVLGVRWASDRERNIACMVAGVITGAIGVLLVYAGVHWASDVVAGWALGAAVGAGVHAAAAALERKLTPAAR